MSAKDVQVAIVYNEEEQPCRGESHDLIALQGTTSTTLHLHQALETLGYHTSLLPVRESLAELENQLKTYSPQNTLILDNCDGFRGINLAAVEVIRLVESLGFKHTGAPAEAIRLCTEKARAKKRLLGHGVPTPRYQIFTRPEGELHLSYPVIVKPATEDGSLGIDLESVVSCPEDLFARLRYVIEAYRQPALVEEFIAGREFAVAMWGNGTIEALPIAEQDYSCINDPMQWLVTYEAKWFPDSFYYQNINSRCPAPLSEEEERHVKETALRAYQAMGLRDFGRVDMRFLNGIPYVIDVNELPDLAPDAGFAHAARTGGFEYSAMVDRIVKNALWRVGWA